MTEPVWSVELHIPLEEPIAGELFVEATELRLLRENGTARATDELLVITLLVRASDKPEACQTASDEAKDVIGHLLPGRLVSVGLRAVPVE